MRTVDPLAVGARHVDHPVALVGIAHLAGQACHRFEAQARDAACSRPDLVVDQAVEMIERRAVVHERLEPTK